mmetsp:Transcript_3027/g.6294  ORF Transcript_3027/g.6294 Transcript_3027/m.6294 type:complete len:240 (+) Transcript_3027:55-774(+)
MSSLLKTLTLPWKFNTFFPSKVTPIKELLHKDLFPQSEGFIQAYRSMIHAIASNDADFLEKVTEPRLFQALKTSLDTVAAYKGKFLVLKPEAEVTLEFCNSKFILGANINRDYEAKEQKFIDMFKWITSERFPNDEVVIVTDVPDLACVVKVDVVFESNMKLVLQDEHGEEAQGSSSDTNEKHVLTFETQSQSDGFFSFTYNNFRASWYAITGMSDWITDYDWQITDIDKHLQGNSPKP